ncbi:MAG: EamA family transporter [Acidobacteriota bacterium]|nr:EamA family transporter [Acidobacteriota bacterium]
MKSFYLPIVLTVGGSLIYHFSQKSIPKTANPLFALVLAYVVSIIACLICAVFYSADKSFLSTVKESNWAVAGVGIGAAAIEVGFLSAYRVGWNISVAAMTMSIAVTVLLIPIGVVMFKERLSIWNILGIAFCILGLVLVSQK